MIILALGSNLSSTFGDRFDNINLAISFIESHNISLIKKSSYYETPSYPDRSRPKYINVVIKISTNLSPENLVPIIISIEEKLGRIRNYRNEPRTCDIDIIDFNSQVMDFEYKNLSFTVPHKKLAHRNFVLIPLKEIFKNWIHPKTNESIDLLINKLSKEDKKSILKVQKS